MREAAAAIGLSPWTIRKMIRSGLLPSVKLGRRRLIEPAALQALVEKGRMEGKQ